MPIETMKKVTGKVMRKLTQYYHKWFQNRNHVFMHKGPFEPMNNIISEIVRYTSFDDIPDNIKIAIERYGGQRTLEIDQLEVKQNAEMWVALIDHQLTGVLFTRRGKNFHRWFVKLEDNDIVIFRMRTYPEFRGRGIAPSLMHSAMCGSLQKSGNAYIDCRIYNKPSIRAIQKTGFELIATIKPITREEALS